MNKFFLTITLSALTLFLSAEVHAKKRLDKKISTSKQKTKLNSNNKKLLLLQLNSTSKNIHAKDTLTKDSGKINSRSGLGIKVVWSLYLSPRMTGSLALNFDRFVFNAPENRKLREDTFLTARIGGHGNFHLFNKFALYEQVYFGDELYYLGVNESYVEVKKGSAFSNRIGLSYRIPGIHTTLFTGLSSSIPSAGNTIATRSGHGPHGGLFVTVPLKNKIFQSGVEYQKLNRDTRRFSQVHEDLKLYLGLGVVW